MTTTDRPETTKSIPIHGTCPEIKWASEEGKQQYQIVPVEFSTTIHLPSSILRFRNVRMGTGHKSYNKLDDLLKELLYVEHAMGKRYYIRALLKMKEIETDYIVVPTESIGEDGTEWEGPPVTEIQTLIEKHRQKISEDIRHSLVELGFSISTDDVTHLTKAICGERSILPTTLEDKIVALLHGLLKNETRTFIVEPPYPKSFDQLFYKLTNEDIESHFKEVSNHPEQLQKDARGRPIIGMLSKQSRRLKLDWLSMKQGRETELGEFLRDGIAPNFDNPIYSFVVLKDTESTIPSVAFSQGLNKKDLQIGPAHIKEHFYSISLPSFGLCQFIGFEFRK